MISFSKTIFKYIKKIFDFILDTIKTIFITGLVTLLPITLTVGLFAFSWNMLKGWLEPLEKIQPEILKHVPHSGIILAILFIFITGTILKLFVLHSIIHFFESILERIPLVRSVYSGIKRIIQAFSVHDKESFKQVVLVEFPRKGIYSIGFLTSKFPKELSPDKEEDFCHVYIPTTPNPTSGFLLMIPKEELVYLDMTFEEASKFIVSAGTSNPKN